MTIHFFLGSKLVSESGVNGEPYTGVIKLSILEGSKLMQMYANFLRDFPKLTVHEVWVGVI